MKLQGKTAVVTGAGSGMGKEIALLFAREGAQVVVSDIQEQNAKNVAQEIEAAGGKAVVSIANVAKEEDVQQMIDLAVSTYGTLDILINNAGIMDNFVPAAEVTDELWEKVIAVNTTGPMRAIRKALPIFTAKKSGVIVNIASVGGLFGSRAGAAYTASKHAVIGLTKNVGFQYAEFGVRCNAIAPGGVETNISSTFTHPSEFGMGKAMSGAGMNPRSGSAKEIAEATLFLASDAASFINGTVLTADAGWTAY